MTRYYYSMFASQTNTFSFSTCEIQQLGLLTPLASDFNVQSSAIKLAIINMTYKIKLADQYFTYYDIYMMTVDAVKKPQSHLVRFRHKIILG